MATEVVWSEPALEELKQVYEYYRSHYSEASAAKIFGNYIQLDSKIEMK